MTTGLPDQLHTDFVGQRGRLFRLAIGTGFLTLLTLGFYRFWAKTRLRRWYWSAIRPGGQPLEYAGDGSEKIAGFFIAVAILAFWLGVVNLLLMVVSLSVWGIPFVTYVLSTLGLVPIYFFARYRARSYTLARTRWRGIRFGMAKGAWGFAMRAVGHLIVTLLSFGVLWPRMTFWLEKYKTDRTFFGTGRFEQGGRWQMLWPAFGHVLVPGYLALATLAVAVFEMPRAGWLMLLFGPWLLVGLVIYRVTALRLMANHKTLGGVALQLDVRPSIIARITGFGYLALVLVLLFPLMLLGGGAGILEATGGFFVASLSELSWLQILALAAIIFGYFLLFLLWAALRHTFVTMPIWRYYASGLTLAGTEVLTTVGQRDRAKANEAEGFAEALDLGAAI